MNTVGAALGLIWLVTLGACLGARGLVERDRWLVVNSSAGFLFMCATGGPWWVIACMLAFVVFGVLALRKAKAIEEVSAKMDAMYVSTIVDVMRSHGHREPEEVGRLMKRTLAELRRRYGP